VLSRVLPGGWSPLEPQLWAQCPSEVSREGRDVLARRGSHKVRGNEQAHAAPAASRDRCIHTFLIQTTWVSHTSYRASSSKRSGSVCLASCSAKSFGPQAPTILSLR
jgi:hypothetical protein